jgi:hypothetical protein
MRVHTDLPLTHFESTEGVSLTQAELLEAVRDYLKVKRKLPIEPIGFHTMSRDDHIVTY